MRKPTKQFLRRIEREGWSWEMRNNGHLRLTGPKGEVVFCCATPSDRYAYRNIRRDMRRAVRERVQTPSGHSA